MRRKLLHIIVFLSLIFVFACSKRPKNIMSKRQMRSFLVDLHVLEGSLGSDYTITIDDKTYYYHNLFEKHGINKAQFDSSIAYYAHDPKKFERIYLRVNKDIENLQADILDYKYHEKPIEELDSLQLVSDSIFINQDSILIEEQIAEVDSVTLSTIDRMRIEWIY